MSHFLVSIAAIVYTANGYNDGADEASYCGFNRGAEPDNEDNAGTYNMINGNYIRDTTSFESGGQTELWQGMPYYRMESPGCFVPYLYLYKWHDHSIYPAYQYWVISPNVGAQPEFGFAYCGPYQTQDLSSPAGSLCDGQWMIGDPKNPDIGTSVANHEQDPYFQVLYGGCPQITCQSIKACSGSNEDFAATVDTSEDSSGNTKCTVYDYFAPNIYYANTDTMGDVRYYAFFNVKTMRWAFSEIIDGDITKEANQDPNYYDCELYKSGKGFEFVSNVNSMTDGNPWQTSTASDGGFWFLYFPGSTSIRYMKCIGSVATPSPTATHAPVPTNAPVDYEADICAMYAAGEWRQLSVTWQIRCGQYSPQPTQSNQVGQPTTLAPVPTPAPVPTTAAPTDINGTPKPNTPVPITPNTPSAPSGNPGNAPSGPSGNPSGSTPTASPTAGANMVSGNHRMWQLCILMALLYQFVF